MRKIALLIAMVFLASCKTPQPTPLGNVSDQNININFNVTSTSTTDNQSAGTFTIGLDLKNDKGVYIEVGAADQIHVFLNSVEYQLVKFYCTDLSGPQYFCGYGFPALSVQEIAKLVQPLEISLEMRRNQGTLITAKANLPRFISMSSSIPAGQKYNPLTDAVQVSWISSVPLKHVLYSAGNYEHSVCYSPKTVIPKPGDTYIQYVANEFGLDTTICNPMSYAIVTAAIDSTTEMQTNVKLGSATIRFNQTMSLVLLSEPFNP